MKRKLIAGNWKMNGNAAANEALVRALIEGMGDAACTVAVCVPAPYLAQVNALRAGSRLELGAQDVSEHVQGAYTGEVSAAMLKEFGVRYVIVGHSERRQYHAETDAVVADKTKAALARYSDLRYKALARRWPSAKPAGRWTSSSGSWPR